MGAGAKLICAQFLPLANVFCEKASAKFYTITVEFGGHQTSRATNSSRITIENKFWLSEINNFQHC
jgi:hypothetical protein